MIDSDGYGREATMRMTESGFDAMTEFYANTNNGDK
jgi:hypothetical protein